MGSTGVPDKYDVMLRRNRVILVCSAQSVLCRECVSIALVAYQVILEPGIGQFREFESPRVHYWYKSVGTFARAQIDLPKARERELATLDEKIDGQ